MQYVHNLLSMTGAGLTLQPFVSADGQRVVLFNGEIYNFKDFGAEYNSDGECILPLYEQHGADFVSLLDGEFAIVVVDYANNTALYTTDVFGTKPLWVAVGGAQANAAYAASLAARKRNGTATGGDVGSPPPPAIGVATYPSALEGLGFAKGSAVQVLPNTATVVSLDAPYETLSTRRLYDFDLRQHKNTADDWEAALMAALRKRVEHVKHPVFVALSGGYDSGLISAGLMAQGFKHHTITIVGDREDEIVYERTAKCGALCMPRYFHLDVADMRRERAWIDHEVEPFTYSIPEPGTVRDRDGLGAGFGQTFKHYDIAEDEASIGVSRIMRLARESGILVYLSGGGVDEIVTDYGFYGKPRYGHFSQSSFAGLFPQNLSDIYPWSNFFAGTQRAYLMKEEHVGSSHGVETRYPFLDVALVQEFLWLTEPYKNALYKHPLDDVLTKLEYPFARGVKMGFHISPCWRSLEPLLGLPIWIGPVDPLGCGLRGLALVVCYCVGAACAAGAAVVGGAMLYRARCRRKALSPGAESLPTAKGQPMRALLMLETSTWHLRQRLRALLCALSLALLAALALLLAPALL
jgi:asparagine synthetase B (glutamine-hydrolysing)